MRMFKDITDPSNLTFVLINTAGGVHAIVRDDVDRCNGVFLFTTEEYIASEVMLGDHIWAGFEENDIVFILLKYSDRVMARITAHELDEARQIITDTAGEANYPGLLTALCMSPHEPSTWRNVLRRWDTIVSYPRHLHVEFDDPSGGAYNQTK